MSGPGRKELMAHSIEAKLMDWVDERKFNKKYIS